jgi:hypothetical protein
MTGRPWHTALHVRVQPLTHITEPFSAQQLPQFEEPRLHLSGFAGDDHVSPSQMLDEAAIEHEDDDYWDVQSDDDMIDREDGENTMVASKEFELIRRIHFENTSEIAVRSYDAFLYEGLLTRYRPEYAASPLRNPKTARVFAHFIHVVSLPVTQPLSSRPQVKTKDKVKQGYNTHALYIQVYLRADHLLNILFRPASAYPSTREIPETHP